MLVTNLEFLPNRKVRRHIGLVQGSSVRSKHVGRDIMASLTREEATERMVAQATALGANAVLNIRYSTSSIASGAAEIFVYGSAVELDDDV